MENYYETLGVPQDATPAQIRVAFRRLVLQHHPDRASGGTSVEAFVAITQAHEVLSDSARRKEYDRLLDLRARRAQERPRTQTAAESPRPRPAPPRPTATMDGELTRLFGLYRRGAFFEAEKVARQILAKDARQAAPYAILGDLARNRGDLAEAARLYALAIQMEPANPVYMKKHEELLRRTHRLGHTINRDSGAGVGPLVAFAMIPLGCSYLILASETPLFPAVSGISTWTLGLFVMLFLGGVALGVGLSLAQFVDRFEGLASNALSRVSPPMALASIALVNFWAAAAFFLVVGLRNRSHTVTTSRLLLGVAVVLGLIALSAAGSSRIDGAQVLLWGGNLVYLGAVCGWMVADSFQ